MTCTLLSSEDGDPSNRTNPPAAAANQRAAFLSCSHRPDMYEHSLFKSMPVMLLLVNPEGRLVDASDLWLAKAGYARDEVVGTMLTDFMPPAFRERGMQTLMPEPTPTGRITKVELQLVCKDGTTINASLSATTVRDPQGHFVSLSVLHDLTERNRPQSALAAEHEGLCVALDLIGEGDIVPDSDGKVTCVSALPERLTGYPPTEANAFPAAEIIRLVTEATHVSATHDTLTGILNRDEFERRLNAALRATCEDRKGYALIYIDLDRLKLVNDAGGRAAGDRLLKQTATVVGQFVHEGGAFARLGGDKFGLLLEVSRVDAQCIARQICRELDAFRFLEGELKFHISASIGLVLVEDNGTTVAGILQAAHIACYAAKAAGRNRVHVYSDSDEAIVSHRNDMLWVRRIQEALDKGQFTLYWQRIVSLNAPALLDRHDGVYGEVLLRMLDEHGKLVMPRHFLPSAERFQIATRIDQWVVRNVFELMASNRCHSAQLDTVSVNLSGQSIGDPDFLQYVLDLMDRLDFDPHKICFEITESAVITNLNDALVFIASMRGRGVRFALDDLGSGVCSIGYLKALPVDYLKIDGQFINALANDAVNQATVRCIGEIAQITGKKTIAEFVETVEVEHFLRQIGIDYGQGYLYHRPAPIMDMFEAAREFEPMR